MKTFLMFKLREHIARVKMFCGLKPVIAVRNSDVQEGTETRTMIFNFFKK